MNSNLGAKNLNVEFENYLGRVFLKNLTLILSLGVVVLSFYIYSDWSVRQNYSGVVTRLIPMALIIALFITHFFYRHKYYRFKNFIYITILLTLQLMMYGKCLIHLHDDGLAQSVTGTILVFFLIAF